MWKKTPIKQAFEQMKQINFVSFLLACDVCAFSEKKHKKDFSEGKQFFLFSDPLCEAGGHSDFPVLQKDRNYYGGLIRWLL